MSELEEQLNIIDRSILWITKEVEALQNKQPLNEKEMLHAINLQKKLSWERKQIEKHE